MHIDGAGENERLGSGEATRQDIAQNRYLPKGKQDAFDLRQAVISYILQWYPKAKVLLDSIIPLVRFP